MNTNNSGEREYTVTGVRTYSIWAKSRTSAIRRASIRYKEEIHDTEYPAEIYDHLFTHAEVVEWYKKGPVVNENGTG